MNDLNWGRRWGRKGYSSGEEMGTGTKNYPSTRMIRYVYGMTSMEDQKTGKISWSHTLQTSVNDKIKLSCFIIGNGKHLKNFER